MKKKFLALVLLMTFLGTVLSGCGDGSAAETQKSRADTNELVVGIAQDLDDSLDPHKTVKAGTREVMFNVFEGLMKPTPNGDLTPAIAESYEVSEDRMTYTFHLREGVQFHNGKTVTAEDVVYSIQRCAAATETGIVQVEAFSVIQDIKTPDDKTVAITISEPSNEFISYMTTAVLPADYDKQDTDPVGTGPFKFVSRTAQDSVVLGIVYNGLLNFDFSTQRYASVLGRIGLAWMCAALLFVYVQTKSRAWIAAALLIGYWLLLAFVPAPDANGADSLTMEGCLVGYVDRLLLPGRLHLTRTP